MKEERISVEEMRKREKIAQEEREEECKKDKIESYIGEFGITKEAATIVYILDRGEHEPLSTHPLEELVSTIGELTSVDLLSRITMMYSGRVDIADIDHYKEITSKGTLRGIPCLEKGSGAEYEMRSIKARYELSVGIAVACLSRLEAIYLSSTEPSCKETTLEVIKRHTIDDACTYRIPRATPMMRIPEVRDYARSIVEKYV